MKVNQPNRPWCRTAALLLFALFYLSVFNRFAANASATAPLTSPVELLQNGGFESSVDHWLIAEGGFFTAITPTSTSGVAGAPPDSMAYLRGPSLGAATLLWQTATLPSIADHGPNSHRRVKLSFNGGGEVIVALHLNASDGSSVGFTKCDCINAPDSDSTFRPQVAVFDPIPATAVTATVFVVLIGSLTRAIADDVSLLVGPSAFYSAIPKLEDGRSDYGQGNFLNYTGVFSNDVFASFPVIRGMTGSPVNLLVNGHGFQGVDPGWTITGGAVEMSMMNTALTNSYFMWDAVDLFGNTVFRCTGPSNCLMAQTVTVPAHDKALSVDMWAHFHSPSQFARFQVKFQKSGSTATFDATPGTSSYTTRGFRIPLPSGWTTVDVEVRMAPGDRAGHFFLSIQDYDDTVKENNNVVLGGAGDSHHPELWPSGGCGSFAVEELKQFQNPNSKVTVYGASPGSTCTYSQTIDLTADLATAQATWDAHEETFLGSFERRFDVRLEATLGGDSSSSKTATAKATFLTAASVVVKTLDAGPMNSAARAGQTTLLVFSVRDLAFDIAAATSVKVDVKFTGNGLYVQDVKVRLIPLLGSCVANGQFERLAADWVVQSGAGGMPSA